MLWFWFSRYHLIIDCEELGRYPRTWDTFAVYSVGYYPQLNFIVSACKLVIQWSPSYCRCKTRVPLRYSLHYITGFQYIVRISRSKGMMLGVVTRISIGEMESATKFIWKCQGIGWIPIKLSIVFIKGFMSRDRAKMIICMRSLQTGRLRWRQSFGTYRVCYEQSRCHENFYQVIIFDVSFIFSYAIKPIETINVRDTIWECIELCYRHIGGRFSHWNYTNVSKKLKVERTDLDSLYKTKNRTNIKWSLWDIVTSRQLNYENLD
jgi:hypothetical protein